MTSSNRWRQRNARKGTTMLWILTLQSPLLPPPLQPRSRRISQRVSFTTPSSLDDCYFYWNFIAAPSTVPTKKVATPKAGKVAPQAGSISRKFSARLSFFGSKKDKAKVDLTTSKAVEELIAQKVAIPTHVRAHTPTSAHRVVHLNKGDPPGLCLFLKFL